MTERCPDHRLIGVGVLKGYRWIISSRGYANIIQSPAGAVYGVIYEISASDERRLDVSEGVHAGSYYKEFLCLEVGGIYRNCLVYIDPIVDEGEPRGEYVSRINHGIEDAKLPSDYVQNSIRKYVPG